MDENPETLVAKLAQSKNWPELPPPYRKILTKEEKSERLRCLDALLEIPATEQLKQLFDKYEDGCDPSTWSVNRFLELHHEVWEMLGTRHSDYFPHLNGPSYEQNFYDNWNKQNPEFPLTIFDLYNGQRPLPTGWSPINRDLGLVYVGNDPAKGIFDLFKGPAVMDCGFCIGASFELLLRLMWGACKYREQRRQSGLAIFQTHHSNSLSRFFREVNTCDDPSIRAPIELQTVFNARSYIFKHPHGAHRFMYTVVANAKHAFFDPEKQNIMSREDLESTLYNTYNRPLNNFGNMAMCVYDTFPNHYLASDVGVIKLQELAKMGRLLEKKDLTEEEWMNDQKGQPDESHLVLDKATILGLVEAKDEAEYWWKRRWMSMNNE